MMVASYVVPSSALLGVRLSVVGPRSVNAPGGEPVFDLVVR